MIRKGCETLPDALLAITTAVDAAASALVYLAEHPDKQPLNEELIGELQCTAKHVYEMAFEMLIQFGCKPPSLQVVHVSASSHEEVAAMVARAEKLN